MTLLASCPAYRLQNEEHLHRHELLESRRIAWCICAYVQRHHGLIGPLFELLSIFSYKSRVDYTFLKVFFLDVVAEQFTVEEKHAVSGRLKEQSLSQSTRAMNAAICCLVGLEHALSAWGCIVLCSMTCQQFMVSVSVCPC